jgi:tetratricopeptide (TPR) repeat protein
MKSTTAILMILAAMTVTPACLADHMLDQASQALSTGDTERAVEMYRQVVNEDPTAEGYNNLGVALERSGRFTEAAEAYGTSLLLPYASRQSKANLYRARLRSIISIGLPYVAGVFGVLLTILMLVWSAGGLRRVRRACCVRMKLRGVRVVSLTHRVLCHDGQDQPDGNAYPDSESISLQADLLLPAYPPDPVARNDCTGIR